MNINSDGDWSEVEAQSGNPPSMHNVNEFVDVEDWEDANESGWEDVEDENIPANHK